MSRHRQPGPAFTVREGSSSVRGYKYGNDSPKSARYCLLWYRFASDKPQRETKTGERAARDRARQIAIELANDRSQILELNGADRETHLRMKTLAAELRIPVFDLFEQAVSAKKIIGAHTLVEAANFFDRGYIARRACPPTSKILAELLDSFDKPRSYRYRTALERDLKKFAAAFPNLPDATAENIRAWLRSFIRLPGSGRRRDNIRDAVVRLSRFAREKTYLPEDRKSEAEKVERIWEGAEVETFSPAELSTLLEHVSPRWQPWMIIAAFAGLRTTEIFRLDWTAVKFDQRVISVKRRIARKIRISRLVPIQDNLLAWLAPYRTSEGRLYPNDNEKSLERALERELDRLAIATRRWKDQPGSGIKWKRNALRHSFGSNRLAVVKSFAQVAVEMGTSPEKIRENYNDPKSEAEGKLYFSIMPPDRINNVLALEFA